MNTTRASAHLPRPAKGFTLVELLIAITLGLLVLGGVVLVFQSNSQNYRQNEALASLQDNARYALDVLGRDLSMAGYWGGIGLAESTQLIGVSAGALAAVAPGDCGPAGENPAPFLLNTGRPLEFRDHLASTAITAQFRCLANVQANTDVVMIRRAAGRASVEVPDGGFGGTFTELNRVYLKTNKTAGVLFYQTAADFNLATPADCTDNEGNATICPPTDAPVQIYAFVPHIYYIRNFSFSEGDGIPALARRALISTEGAAPTMQEELLAPGVEDLQIEWGIDSNNDLIIDRYSSTPTFEELAFNVQTARIHLLVRASTPGSNLTGDTKTFELGNAPPRTLSGVLRRSFTATVTLRNLAP